MIRSLVLVVVVSSLSLLVACGAPKAKCDAVICPAGCCDAQGSCMPGTLPSACGVSGGFSCQVCAQGLLCSAGACVSPGTGGGSGGGASGGGAGGGTGGGATGGSGGGSTGGGGGSGGGGGGALVICSALGTSCSCPDAGPSCTSAQPLDDPYLRCLHERCTSYCNAPTQPERDAKCPLPFTCTNYAFGNESPTWQCR
ncbi:MAG: hypothetical protein Q8L48_34545 [Archangium sp.]|nr:hypothetical protein [Archangium sp.]